MILLSETKIRQLLSNDQIQHSLAIHVFDSINSTNRYLKELPREYKVDLCCAETQTQGRGRFAREWFSPFGENIYCSTRWNLGKNPADLSALSLVTGLAVIATLNELDIADNIAIKWPNDLIWQDKKLCGVLIESFKESNGEIIVIIGIGLNVNSSTHKETIQAQLDRPWCSLLEITKQSWDRNLIIAKLIIQLEQHINRLMATGFSTFITTWEKWDYLYGKQIEGTNLLGGFQGMADGVDNSGQLILIDNNGLKHYISSGEASLCGNRREIICKL
ncbi:MAG: biotin--[acetyl-CoA-carboxylase] ligase [Legionellaceae bacterium]|nr:biotin--[acetyl-CoA-carboxylase] ligase [Legionellaceae bacterium]